MRLIIDDAPHSPAFGSSHIDGNIYKTFLEIHGLHGSDAVEIEADFGYWPVEPEDNVNAGPVVDITEVRWLGPDGWEPLPRMIAGVDIYTLLENDILKELGHGR